MSIRWDQSTFANLDEALASPALGKPFSGLPLHIGGIPVRLDACIPVATEVVYSTEATCPPSGTLPSVESPIDTP